MVSKEIKDKVLKENDLDKAIEILKPYKDEKWDDEIIKHLQSIIPDTKPGIEEFSYIRPKNK